jgi:hypothetical protein
MGAITRSIANNITTSGVFTSSAITNASVTGITVLPNAEDGITLISSQTASNSASLSFTSGLTSTYKAYKFVFSSIHPRTDGAIFEFNLSTDSGSNYNVTKTSTFFRAIHNEADSSAQLSYNSALDLAQETTFQGMVEDIGNGADEANSGTLLLFNPSSTTYVKHYISNLNAYQLNNASIQHFIAGYGNTTSAINAIRFQMSSGNMDGTIYLYGIK